MFNWLISDEDYAEINFHVDKEIVHHYEASTSNHFKVNEMTMNKCENRYLFDVAVIAKVKEGYIFDWTVKEKSLYKGMEYLGEHLTVLEKLAGIKDHLRLLINRDGQISNVLNKEEINNNWLNIRDSLYNRPEDWPIEDQYRTKFINDGDKEHSLDFPLEHALNEDPLFATFFFQNTKDRIKEGEDALVRISQYSNLLMSGDTEKLPIPLIQNTSWKKAPEGNGFIDFVISRNADKGKLDKAKMNKFLKNFPFAEQELRSYIYDYEAGYHINENTLMINEAKYNLLEKINHDLEVNHFCNIKLIN